MPVSELRVISAKGMADLVAPIYQGRMLHPTPLTWGFPLNEAHDMRNSQPEPLERANEMDSLTLFSTKCQRLQPHSDSPVQARVCPSL
jgi:hypothetical protein